MEDFEKITQVIDDFAQAMKNRMKEKLDEGYTGWDDPDNVGETEGRLENAVEEHLNDSPHEVNIANLAMILWYQRTQHTSGHGDPRVTRPETPEPEGEDEGTDTPTTEAQNETEEV